MSLLETEKSSSYAIKEEKNFVEVVYKCVIRGEEWFDPINIKRAVSVSDGKELWGFFITIEQAGVRSFHGYNFTKGNHWLALKLSRQYIKEEGLEFSMIINRALDSFMKRLGFKDFADIDKYHVMRVFRDNRGFAAVPLFVNVIIAALAGAGIAEGISALSSTPKAPSAPAAPTETAAASTAQAAQTQQRQAALASGGSTNVTQGSGIILGSDVSSVTLVGSS